jgi:hypothetical protein
MTALVRSELRKPTATRLWLWMLVLGSAMTGAATSATIGFAEPGPLSLQAAAGQRREFAQATATLGALRHSRHHRGHRRVHPSDRDVDVPGNAEPRAGGGREALRVRGAGPILSGVHATSDVAQYLPYQAGNALGRLTSSVDAAIPGQAGAACLGARLRVALARVALIGGAHLAAGVGRCPWRPQTVGSGHIPSFLA